MPSLPAPICLGGFLRDGQALEWVRLDGSGEGSGAGDDGEGAALGEHAEGLGCHCVYGGWSLMLYKVGRFYVQRRDVFVSQSGVEWSGEEICLDG
jgi:hypothetical protein